MASYRKFHRNCVHEDDDDEVFSVQRSHIYILINELTSSPLCVRFSLANDSLWRLNSDHFGHSSRQSHGQMRYNVVALESNNKISVVLPGKWLYEKSRLNVCRKHRFHHHIQIIRHLTLTRMCFFHYLSLDGIAFDQKCSLSNWIILFIWTETRISSPFQHRPQSHFPQKNKTFPTVQLISIWFACIDATGGAALGHGTGTYDIPKSKTLCITYLLHVFIALTVTRPTGMTKFSIRCFMPFSKKNHFHCTQTFWCFFSTSLWSSSSLALFESCWYHKFSALAVNGHSVTFFSLVSTMHRHTSIRCTNGMNYAFGSESGNCSPQMKPKLQ